MLSAKSIMLKKSRLRSLKIFSLLFFASVSLNVFAQSNSPYSRFGLGDVSAGTNVTLRGLGGISAGYADILSVNFNNPASYSQFQAFVEQRSKKLSSGRVVLDVGTNFESRSLIAPNTANKFTSNDLLFSYVQVGLPLRKNWGLSFGIRPLSRISYLINSDDSLKDPISGNTIERAITQFRGTGGSYLPSIGTGFAIKNFSAGFNVGYLFGNRENTTLRSLVNDSIQYYSSEHSATSSFGHVFFNAGIQYLISLSGSSDPDITTLRLGASGNWKQTINGTQDRLVQTFTRGSAGEELRIDSVYENNGSRGEVVYPSSYKGGFVFQKMIKATGSGWLLGADYTTSKWSEYRFFGQKDSVQDSWMLNVGGQLTPRPRSNYFSRITYRFGVFTGKDYIKVQDDLPVFGASFGVALPVRPNRLAMNQFTIFNLGFEYMKRGNDDNRLKENLFRLSLGLNLSDLWFGKRKYE
jgi:hypothetical protein